LFKTVSHITYTVLVETLNLAQSINLQYSYSFQTCDQSPITTMYGSTRLFLRACPQSHI